MSIISLLTDFGTRDGYVGVMKGVIWSIAPQAHIADLSHEVPPQNILVGAMTLDRCARFFPPGTVHVGVVDPGVGTERRSIAALLGRQYFVGPDNGLATLLLEAAERNGDDVAFFNLDKPAYWLDNISASFHGRDIFAPVGAHLANGVPISMIGTAIDDPVRITMPVPQQIPNGWKGQIMRIDHFGNCATNLSRADLSGLETADININGQSIHGMVKSFGDRSPGKLIAMFNSDDRLEIAVVNGNASQLLHARVGDPIEILAKDQA